MERRAYAKLNLALAITGRREDGYHTLDMIMQGIGLYDTVWVQKSHRLHVECEAGCDEKKNTAYRAATLFFAETGIVGGADIAIQKNIPAQAGLGGGSSDAAATLRVLNEMYGAGLSPAQMCALALRVGADVPFFLEGGCMRAQGVGERLTPLQNRCGFSYLLVKPEGGVATAQAYLQYHERKKQRVDVAAAVVALEAGDRKAFYQKTGNALEAAGCVLCPQVGAALADCRAQGAEFAMMTGSGSCVFAVFSQKQQLDGAFCRLRPKYPFVQAVEDMAGDGNAAV